MIKQVALNELLPYKKEAERAGLCFARNTLYFANFEDNKITSFIGILLFRNKAIIKNIYVLHEHRGKGYFKEMLGFVIERILDSGISRIEATCTDMSIREFYRKKFKVMRKYKHYTKVVLDLENISQ
jgi:GNAT superfamily N-acetyltransferase